MALEFEKTGKRPIIWHISVMSGKVLKYIFVVIQPSHFYVRRDCSLFSVSVKSAAVNRIFRDA